MRRAASIAVAMLLVCLSAERDSAQRRASFRSGGGLDHPGADRQQRILPSSTGPQRQLPPRNSADGLRGRYPGETPPGHLAAWLNQHQGLSLPQQERLLRNEPSFHNLPPAAQQRLMRQLSRLDQMPEAQRERRLARSAMIERMSPEEQMRVRQAGRSYLALPPARQALLKNAFRDLRAVPLDQRDTVLNSARYRSLFTPDERGILSNLLRAEPYAPAGNKP